MNHEDSLGLTFFRIKKEAMEAKIRLYGVLWYLWENGLISEGKARELGKRDLGEMIQECLELHRKRDDYFLAELENEV